MADTTETAVYKLRVEGQAEIDRLTKSVNDLAKAEDTATAAARTASQGLQNQIARMDPLVKANQQYQKALEANLKYREAGKGTEEQLAAHLEAARTRYIATTEAIQKNGTALVQHANQSKLARYELINLGRQANDVVVSLQGGQGFGTVMLQQGSQIVDVFTSSNATLKGFASQVTEWAGKTFTATRVVAGGFVAVAASVAFAAGEWQSAQKDIERSLIGIGARTGTTVADVNKFASANASATGLSVDQARAAAIAFTKTGDIAVGSLKGLGEAVHGYSILTGKDATEATKDLAQALSGDLVKGAQQLNQTYGFLNPAMEDNIRKLINSGERAKAQQIIIQAMAADNKKAEESVGFLSRAWDAAGNAYSRFKNVVGQGFGNTDKALSNLGGPETKSATDRGVQNLFAGDKTASGFAAFTTQQNEIANKADAATRAIIPQIAAIEELEKKYADLGRAQTESGGGNNGAAQQAIQNQLQALKESTAEAARYNQRVAEISKQWGNVGQSVALQLQAMQNVLPVAEAWTNAGRMRAQEQATYLNLLDKGLSKEEASALAAKEYELSKAAAVSSAQQLVQASEDNLDKIRAQGTGMEGVVDASIAYRDAIQSGASALQANIIAANTLEASMRRVAQAASSAEMSSYLKANGFDSNGVTTMDSLNAYASAASASGQMHGGSFSSDPGPDGFGVGGYGSGTQAYMEAYIKRFYPDMSATDLADSVLKTGGIDAAISAVKSGKTPSGLGSVTDTLGGLQTLYSLKNQGADSATQIGNDQQFISWLQSQPATIENLKAIGTLTDEIKSLSQSTDSLTRSNQDLLSPYYTQDPRTSHIGFRSQGMASTGYIDIPGMPSANDNMTLTLPVASGERVSVGNGPNRGNGGKTININVTNNIAAGANVDQFKRTSFQNTQNMVNQIRNAS